MAYRTRNVTFEARLFWYMACIERGILHLERASGGLWNTEQGMLHLKRSCFGIWLTERGILHIIYYVHASPWLLTFFTTIVAFRAQSRLVGPIFETRLFRFMAYRTKNVTFKARLFWLGILLFERASGAPNVNFRKISVRKAIWDLEFSEHLL